MAKRTINWARVYYKIANNKTVSRRWLSRLDEIFVTTDDLQELNKDKMILYRLANNCNKKIDDIDIQINAVEFISEHGETTDRF
jgi:hypothetical protein